MSISINKYVSIQSGVGGASGVRARDLILRYITPSPNLLPGEVVEFTSLSDVEARFPTTSPEYAAAALYFAYISKSSTSPRKLSMARWNKTATNPILSGAVGISGAQQLTQIQAATTFELLVDPMDGSQAADLVVTVDFSEADSYDTVRSTLQAALRLQANPNLAAATVTYTAATGQFQIIGGAQTTAKFTCVPQQNQTTDAARQLGLLPEQGAQSIPGAPIQTPLEAVTASVETSDNFATFAFIDSTANPPQRLVASDVKAIATWNSGLNNKFMFLTPCDTNTAVTAWTDLQTLSGCAETINLFNDYAEMVPGEILAATDYTRPNSSTNYMFVQPAGRTPTVTTTSVSDAMDDVRANYIGQTMQAGQKIAFYQRGVLMGNNNVATDMNTYANEIWFKDTILTAIMSAFLALPRIPANDEGRGIVAGNIQYAIDQALNNGVISIDKPLTAVQKQYIGQVTGDPNAWQQIQNSGWWLDVQIVSYTTNDGRVEYKASYVLVYAKDDQIRKVEGSDILI